MLIVLRSREAFLEPSRADPRIVLACILFKRSDFFETKFLVKRDRSRIGARDAR